MPLGAGFQRFFETDAGAVIVKEGETTVAAEGEEMKMALVLRSLEAGWHG